MMIKKDVVIAILATFCLTVTLFMIVPTRSSTSDTIDYDPWADINDDGKINMYDIGYTARLFGTIGTAINKTELLLELQSRIDSLNSSVFALQGLESYLEMEVVTMRAGYDAKFAELQTTINTLNATIAELQDKNAELEDRVALLETLHNLPLNWSDGLVGCWKFDEGSGVVVGDTSGNGNNGTLQNGPMWVDGKYGKALSFDGIDDYVMIPDSPSIRVQNFTLEAWIYMIKRPYQHGDLCSAIIDKIDFFGGSGTKGYKLMFEMATSTNDNLVISVGDGVTQRYLINYNSISDLTLGHWHHVAGTYDGTTARIYIDGELKASSGPITFAVLNDDAPLGIGQEVTAIPQGPGYFNGLVDNVIIYNRALSAEEVTLHYLLPPP